MIKLELPSFIFFYIALFVIIMLISWIISSYKKTGLVERKGRDYIWKCSVCYHNYIDSRHEEISTCPMCGSYNTKEVSA